MGDTLQALAPLPLTPAPNPWPLHPHPNTLQVFALTQWQLSMPQVSQLGSLTLAQT